MKIYTRTGDDGSTSLVGGSRISKDDIRVHIYGTCDEANSMIGLALSLINDETWQEKEPFMEQLFRVQTTLFYVGAQFATPESKRVAWELKEKHVIELERQIDKWNEQLPSLTQFILPYGNKIASTLHVARTVVRRAERLAVSFQEQLKNRYVLQYLNRLSDFLFVATRYINYRLDGEEKQLHHID